MDLREGKIEIEIFSCMNMQTIWHRKCLTVITHTLAQFLISQSLLFWQTVDIHFRDVRCIISYQLYIFLISIFDIGYLIVDAHFTYVYIQITFGVI